jgi:hypothetical protein
VEARLWHASGVEPCGASLSTDGAAVVSIGVAIRLITASKTAHRLPWAWGSCGTWHPRPATTGCSPWRGTSGNPGSAL